MSSQPDRSSHALQPRYKTPNLPVENLELYHSGGYHPASLGDTLGSNYRIIRKLGHGSFSTVWLARDELVGRYVAIKILRADALDTESNILTDIAKSNPGHQGHESIVEPLDSFIHEGANGAHRCVVFDIMEGPVKEIQGWDVTTLKVFCENVLRGLALVHGEGYVHCDLHSENVLYSTLRLEADGQFEMLDNISGACITIPVEHLDGSPVGAYAPKYVYSVVPKSNARYLKDTKNLTFKIADFGCAIKSGGKPTYTSTPLPFPAPEQMLDKPLDSKTDIWAFGCALFSIVTGDDIVIPATADEVLFEKITAPLCLVKKLENNRTVIKTYSERYLFVNFLKKMLKWDPAKRWSAEELLKHAWLKLA